MKIVTKAMLAEVWRSYLKTRVDECGGTRKFAAALHFKTHNRITKILKGSGFMSPELIIAVADNIGPSVSDIYKQIAKDCIDAEVNTAKYARVRTGKASAPVPVGTEKDVEKALRAAASDDRLRPKGRRAPEGESEDVPPLGLHEEVPGRSSGRS